MQTHLLQLQTAPWSGYLHKLLKSWPIRPDNRYSYRHPLEWVTDHLNTPVHDTYSTQEPHGSNWWVLRALAATQQALDTSVLWAVSPSLGRLAVRFGDQVWTI